VGCCFSCRRSRLQIAPGGLIKKKKKMKGTGIVERSYEAVKKMVTRGHASYSAWGADKSRRVLLLVTSTWNII